MSYVASCSLNVVPAITCSCKDFIAGTFGQDGRRQDIAFGDSITARTFNKRTQAALEVGHVVPDHLRQEGELQAHLVTDTIVAVVGINLHGFNYPLGWGMNELGIPTRVAMVAFPELTSRVARGPCQAYSSGSKAR